MLIRSSDKIVQFFVDYHHRHLRAFLRGIVRWSWCDMRVYVTHCDNVTIAISRTAHHIKMILSSNANYRNMFDDPTSFHGTYICAWALHRPTQNDQLTWATESKVGVAGSIHYRKSVFCSLSQSNRFRVLWQKGVSWNCEYQMPIQQLSRHAKIDGTHSAERENRDITKQSRLYVSCALCLCVCV